MASGWLVNGGGKCNSIPTSVKLHEENGLEKGDHARLVTGDW